MSAHTPKPSSDPSLGVSLPAAGRILDSIQAGFFALDPEWRFTYVNAFAERILKQSRENLIGKCIWEVYADAIESDFYRQYQRARREQIEVVFEAFYKPLERWVEVHAHPDNDTLSVWFYDITERKQKDEQFHGLRVAYGRAEEALRSSQELYRTILETTLEGVWLLDSVARTTFVNERMAAMLGYTAGEMRGRPFTDFLDKESRIEAAERRERHLQGVPEQHDFRLLRSDGEVLWAILSSTPMTEPDGRHAGTLMMLSDITGRKQAEDALRASEERFRAFMENSPTFAWIKDEQGQHVFLSKSYEKRFGVRLEDWRGKTDFDIWPPDLAQKFRDTDLEALTSGQTTEAIEETITPDGNRAVWWKFKFPMHDATGAKYVGGVGVDITEHRRADEALRQSEARLRLALDAAKAGIWEWDLQTNESIWSDELWELYGLEPRSCEPSYENWLKTMHPQDREMAQGAIEAAARDGIELTLEYRVVRPNGEVRWLMSRGRPVCDVNSHGLRFVGIVFDITERKKAESALIRSEKLASVGRMAASIAHEINNPLAAVMNTLFLARMDAELPVSAQQYLDVADEELKRISVITRQALGFYRESSAPAAVSVAAIMDSAVEVLKSRIKAKHAAIRKEYDCDLLVVAVSGELRQVFSNLLMNSLDAIGERGTIKLRVSSCRCPGNGRTRVRVTVADDGCGIETPILSHVFEPFFTTKEALGTGLGLWISKQIVDKHGGAIRVHSRTRGAHRGTAFSIVLPACA